MGAKVWRREAAVPSSAPATQAYPSQYAHSVQSNQTGTRKPVVTPEHAQEAQAVCRNAGAATTSGCVGQGSNGKPPAVQIAASLQTPAARKVPPTGTQPQPQQPQPQQPQESHQQQPQQQHPQQQQQQQQYKQHQHHHRATNHVHGAHPRVHAGPGSAACPPFKKPRIDNTAQNVENKLQQTQREMEELRRALLEKQRALLKQQQEQKLQEAEREQLQEQQRELQRKREQLKRSFGSVAGSVVHSVQPAGAGTGTGGQAGDSAPRMVADAQEVERVLSSGSDHACLKLHVGASLSQVRRSYRQLAMSLHPDKCSLEGAAAAFQRLHSAYNNLSRLMGG